MATSKARTVEAYLAELPEDRRMAITAVRKVILKNLPKGYKEDVQYGGISYVIPLETYPYTYSNGQPLTITGLASRKNYISLYLMGCYGVTTTEKWFKEKWKASGKKLDMGKCCLRFKKVDDLALDVIGELIARVPVERFIQIYEASRKK